MISSKDQFELGHVEVTLSEFETDLVVVGRADVAEGVVQLSLCDKSGADLPHWSAGAHIDLFVNGLTRQYSLCGDPRDRKHWQVAILDVEDGRGGSRYIHEQVQVDSVVRVRGPRNHFVLQPSPKYLFIAGGIGITPILAMIAEAEQRGAQWRLLYGGRTAASMAFVNRVSAYGDRVVVWPQDRDGLLDLEAELGSPLEDTLVYCCGPEPLLAAVEARCSTWPTSSLHLERFKKREQEESELALEFFEVELRQSELVLQIPPDRSIIEVVEAADVDVFSSCLEGVCGSCETAVIEGVPDHRDSVLSAEDRAKNNYMMICVSRSRSARLVLDL